MEKKSPTPMTPFDEWTVPNELHTLKLLLPYTPAASQQALGILIKVMELQNTIQYFDRQKNLLHEQDFSPGVSSPMKMLEEISPYLPPEQANMLETFRNVMNMMDMVQMMQNFSNDTGNTSAGDNDFESENSNKTNSFMNFGGSGSGFDPMQLVMGMLSPEQKDMFEMYQTMFSQTDEPAAPEDSPGNASASENMESEAAVPQTYDESQEYDETAYEESREYGESIYEKSQEYGETTYEKSQEYNGARHEELREYNGTQYEEPQTYDGFLYGESKINNIERIDTDNE